METAEATQTARARRAVDVLGAAPANWVVGDGADTDVTIIGGGQSGLAIGFALRRAGIPRFEIFDDAPEGTDVWNTVARMKTLRTPKTISSLELGVPELSFRAWYEALYGAAAFARIVKIPTPDWAHYVQWYKTTTGIAVTRGHRLTGVRPRGSSLELTIAGPAGVRRMVTRKLVLATGMGGMGERIVPAPLRALPPALWAHTHDAIDFSALWGKRVAVLGAASAAFDAAATALDHGADRVELFCRHTALAVQAIDHKLTFITDIPLMRRFVDLPDALRWRIMTRVRARGVVPQESIDRAQAFGNFALRLGAGWDATEINDDGSVTLTSSGTRSHFDFLIAGTGYSVDLAARPELRHAEPFIARWSDCYCAPPDLRDATFARYPYVGADFSFQERVTGTAPWLANIHVFNVAAVLNHGFHVGDISSAATCVPRLVDALAKQLFVSDLPGHLAKLLDPAETRSTISAPPLEVRQNMLSSE